LRPRFPRFWSCARTRESSVRLRIVPVRNGLVGLVTTNMVRSARNNGSTRSNVWPSKLLPPKMRAELLRPGIASIWRVQACKTGPIAARQQHWPKSLCRLKSGQRPGIHTRPILPSGRSWDAQLSSIANLSAECARRSTVPAGDAWLFQNRKPRHSSRLAPQFTALWIRVVTPRRAGAAGSTTLAGDARASVRGRERDATSAAGKVDPLPPPPV